MASNRAQISSSETRLSKSRSVSSGIVDTVSFEALDSSRSGEEEWISDSFPLPRLIGRKYLEMSPFSRLFVFTSSSAPGGALRFSPELEEIAAILRGFVNVNAS